MSDAKHKILCVDDEPRVLQALNRHLREHFEVFTAANGAEGVDIVNRERDLAVVVSDMRMPEMDGATFLRHTRMLQPTAVRVLLTGQADIAAAIKAINEGQIFRFVTKPCPPEQLQTVMDEAVRQYELVIAERILLQRTVVGSIKAMTDIMSLVSPAVVGRAVRLRRRVSALATELKLEERWQLEAAALLSHLGHLSLPESVAYKLSQGTELDADETARLNDAMQAANRLIAHVPRLEPVSAILTAVAASDADADADAEANMPVTPDPLHVQILRLAIDVDRLESQGMQPSSVIDTLRLGGDYPSKLLDSLERSMQSTRETLERGEIAVNALEIGMILDEDLRTTRDVLIAPRGCEVTLSFLEHIRHFTRQLSRPTIAVYLRGSLVSDDDVREGAVSAG
jgi:CheY-like chemotaxis protein